MREANQVFVLFHRVITHQTYSLLGVLLLAGIKIEHAINNALDIIRQLRSFIKNPCELKGSVGELVERKLEKVLPENAHELCSGRLGISVTKLWTFQNEFVSEFHSRRELIDAVCAGCFIPLWSGSLRPPIVRGKKCIDGAYSNNKPKFPCTRTSQRTVFDKSSLETAVESEPRQVLVSAFACDVDVSPKGETFLFRSCLFGNYYLCNWNNLVRTYQAVIPFSLDKYRVRFVDGHHDMKDYLMRSNLIQCRKCWSDRVHLKTDMISRSCLICLRLLEQVDSLEVHKNLLKMFEE